ENNADGSATFKDLRFNRAFVNDAQGNALYVNQAAGQSGRIQNGPGGYAGGWVFLPGGRAAWARSLRCCPWSCSGSLAAGGVLMRQGSQRKGFALCKKSPWLLGNTCYCYCSNF
ncbi:MAG: hypothetical protein QE485_17425, partial [Acidovorax sp.]|uniref:hypothetical protein n=1 Tax=Acidovorax sp. TaxID=1872122 RepID=UPI0026021DED